MPTLPIDEVPRPPAGVGRRRSSYPRADVSLDTELPEGDSGDFMRPEGRRVRHSETELEDVQKRTRRLMIKSLMRLRFWGNSLSRHSKESQSRPRKASVTTIKVNPAAADELGTSPSKTLLGFFRGFLIFAFLSAYVVSFFGSYYNCDHVACRKDLGLLVLDFFFGIVFLILSSAVMTLCLELLRSQNHQLAGEDARVLGEGFRGFFCCIPGFLESLKKKQERLPPLVQIQYSKEGKWTSCLVGWSLFWRMASRSAVAFHNWRGFRMSRLLRNFIWGIWWLIGTSYWRRPPPGENQVAPIPWSFKKIPEWYFFGEKVFLASITCDFIIRVVASNPKRKLLFSGTALLENITLPPFIWLIESLVLKDHPVEGGRDFMTIFGFLRFLRLYGTMKNLQRNFPLINPSRLQVISITLALFAALMIYASLFFIFEGSNTDGSIDDGESNHGIWPDYIYFAIITISTIGYGDLSPKRYVTRVFTIVFVVFILLWIPGQFQLLVDLAHAPAISRGTMPSGWDKGNFVLLIGPVLPEQVDVFLSELVAFSDKIPKKILILTPQDPNLYAENIASANDLYGIRMGVKKGDAGDFGELDDLSSVYASDAQAVFVFSDAKATNPVQEDRNTIIRCLGLRKFVPMSRVVVQLMQDSARELAFSLGCESVVCFTELKMRFLAKSCTDAPGLSTLVTNLLRSAEIPLNPTETEQATNKRQREKEEKQTDTHASLGWKEEERFKEYAQGTHIECYRFAFPEVLVGKPFKELVLGLNEVLSVTLFGIVRPVEEVAGEPERNAVTAALAASGAGSAEEREMLEDLEEGRGVVEEETGGSRGGVVGNGIEVPTRARASFTPAAGQTARSGGTSPTRGTISAEYMQREEKVILNPAGETIKWGDCGLILAEGRRYAQIISSLLQVPWILEVDKESSVDGARRGSRQSAGSSSFSVEERDGGGAGTDSPGRIPQTGRGGANTSTAAPASPPLPIGGSPTSASMPGPSPTSAVGPEQPPREKSLGPKESDAGGKPQGKRGRHEKAQKSRSFSRAKTKPIAPPVENHEGEPGPESDAPAQGPKSRAPATVIGLGRSPTGGLASGSGRSPARSPTGTGAGLASAFRRTVTSVMAGLSGPSVSGVPGSSSRRRASAAGGESNDGLTPHPTGGATGRGSVPNLPNLHLQLVEHFHKRAQQAALKAMEGGRRVSVNPTDDALLPLIPKGGEELHGRRGGEELAVSGTSGGGAGKGGGKGRSWSIGDEEGVADEAFGSGAETRARKLSRQVTSSAGLLGRRVAGGGDHGMGGLEEDPEGESEDSEEESEESGEEGIRPRKEKRRKRHPSIDGGGSAVKDSEDLYSRAIARQIAVRRRERLSLARRKDDVARLEDLETDAFASPMEQGDEGAPEMSFDGDPSSFAQPSGRAGLLRKSSHRQRTQALPSASLQVSGVTSNLDSKRAPLSSLHQSDRTSPGASHSLAGPVHASRQRPTMPVSPRVSEGSPWGGGAVPGEREPSVSVATHAQISEAARFSTFTFGRPSGSPPLAPMPSDEMPTGTPGGGRSSLKGARPSVGTAVHVQFDSLSSKDRETAEGERNGRAVAVVGGSPGGLVTGERPESVVSSQHQRRSPQPFSFFDRGRRALPGDLQSQTGVATAIEAVSLDRSKSFMEVMHVDEARDFVWKDRDRPFLLVCGWPRTLHAFLHSVQAGGGWNILILSPEVPPPWSSMFWVLPYRNFTALLRGSPLRHADLKRAGVLSASGFAVFATRQDPESSAAEHRDVDSILICHKIQAMRLQHFIEKEVRSLMAAQCQQKEQEMLRKGQTMTRGMGPGPGVRGGEGPSECAQKNIANAVKRASIGRIYPSRTDLQATGGRGGAGVALHGPLAAATPTSNGSPDKHVHGPPFPASLSPPQTVSLAVLPQAPRPGHSPHFNVQTALSLPTGDRGGPSGIGPNGNGVFFLSGGRGGNRPSVGQPNSFRTWGIRGSQQGLQRQSVGDDEGAAAGDGGTLRLTTFTAHGSEWATEDFGDQALRAMLARRRDEGQATIVTELRQTKNVRFLDADFWWPSQRTRGNLRAWGAGGKFPGAAGNAMAMAARNRSGEGGREFPDDAGGGAHVNYLDSPEYAAGRVFIDHMLYGLACQSRTVCSYAVGIHVVEALLGSNPSAHKTGVVLMALEETMVGMSYKQLFYTLVARGLVPMGIYRDATVSDRLPYVYTAPVPDAVLTAHDQIFILPPMTDITI